MNFKQIATAVLFYLEREDHYLRRYLAATALARSECAVRLNSVSSRIVNALFFGIVQELACDRGYYTGI